MADVTLMPEWNVFHGSQAVRSYKARQTGEVFRGDRIPLVWHGRGALLPLGKEFLRFQHLSSLEVSEFDRKFLYGGSKDGQGGEELSMMISLNNLC